ncbi:MAG: DNA topoisomerase, partial [Actinobacteria bacterium]|nr:DNA topoisomerase [Actinomycetota bacterium]
YSQGKLIQEMESCGLGTKSTRHSIIERLYDVRYVQNDPIEPTALGLAICDALEKFAPHITSPDMTAELEREMDNIAAGKTSQEAVVTHSRTLLAEIIDDLIPRKEEMGLAIADAAAADARVGACPKCGNDLLVKSSAKTRSNFVGCSSWPDCDVTYPLPQGKLEAIDELCPLCGTPQIKVTPFRSKPKIFCLDPQCQSNKEPEVFVGTCPACAADGREGRLIAQKSPRTLKRFVRCTNYDLCQTSYPLPQNGALSYEDEICETCGAPVVVVQSRRGPWHVCVNMSCPAKEEAEKGKAEKGKAAKKSTEKKPAAKKPAAKKTTEKKSAEK